MHDAPNETGPDSLCSICITLVWRHIGNGLDVHPVDEHWKSLQSYPSRLIDAVLAGTHTASLRDTHQQLAIRTATIWRGTPLCLSHAAELVSREHLSPPHSHGGYRR